MKNIIIIIVIGVSGYFGYQHFSGKGPFGDNAMVAYGAVEFETGSGIQEVTPYDPFNAEDYVEPDQPSIIELYSSSCPGCKRLHGHLKRFLKVRPDVVVTQIHLGRYWSSEDVWNSYRVDVYSVPHIIIYGPNGKLIAKDNGKDKSGLEFLYDWMNDEINKDLKKRYEQRNKPR
ncbi:MAG: thioredoxin family protein [Desulfobacteraceae bacterium]|jgi:thiol-disulfide isomerase/thioredoxin